MNSDPMSRATKWVLYVSSVIVAAVILGSYGYTGQVDNAQTEEKREWRSEFTKTLDKRLQRAEQTAQRGQERLERQIEKVDQTVEKNYDKIDRKLDDLLKEQRRRSP